MRQRVTAEVQRATTEGLSMTIAASDIFKCIDPITRAVANIPRTVLLPGERMGLAGHVFNEADTFVRAVARGLDQGAAFFDDIPIEGADLAERQDRALGYLTLHSMLSALTARVADCYLAEQAGAVQDAMAVVRQVRSEGDQPFVRPDHEGRRVAMLSAEDVLDRRQARKRRVWRDSKARDARQAGPLFPGPSTPGPQIAPDPASAEGAAVHLSHQEKAMREVQKAENDQMMDAIISNLASHSKTPESSQPQSASGPSMPSVTMESTETPTSAMSLRSAAEAPEKAARGRADRAHKPGLSSDGFDKKPGSAEIDTTDEDSSWRKNESDPKINGVENNSTVPRRRRGPIRG